MRRITLAEAVEIAIKGLLKAEAERQEAARKEAEFWRRLEGENPA